MRLDSHLTGVKKESFYGSQKQQHITTGFRESEKKVAMLKMFQKVEFDRLGERSPE